MNNFFLLIATLLLEIPLNLKIIKLDIIILVFLFI